MNSRTETPGLGKTAEVARSVVLDTVDHGIIDSAYLSGSVAVGLGNSTSDVDVFVVVRDEATHDLPVRQVVRNGLRFDIEFCDVRTILATARSVTDWRAAKSDLSALRMSRIDLDFALRLFYGADIIASESLSLCRAQLDAYSGSVRRLVLSWWSLRAAMYFEDFDGACQEGDADLAGVTGRALIHAAGKALAAAAGDLYVGEKWVYKQLARSMSQDFPIERFRSYMNAAWTDKFNRGQLELAWFAQNCVIASLAMGWFEPRVQYWPTWNPLQNSVRYARGLMPIRLTDAVLLNGERKIQYLVDPATAMLWGLAHGQDEVTYVKSAIQCSLLSPGYSGISEDYCLRVRQELLAREMLVDDSSL